MNNRRKLLVVLGAASFAPQAVLAQAKPKAVLIGWLNFYSRETSMWALAAFKEGLAALGWKEGGQFIIEERWVDGRSERLQPLAEELAANKPAVIVAGQPTTVRAAAKAAPTTPIVHASGGDPVVSGFAASYARPGGMITGLSNVQSDATEKYLEFLLALAPKLRRIGILTSGSGLGPERLREAVRRSVAYHSIELRFEGAEKPEDIEPAISRLAKHDVQALMVLPLALLAAERPRIVKLALAHRWPVIGASRVWPESGAALSYGPDASENFRRAAYYVDRILKGTKPGDLPIEQPTKIELVINAKTAKMLGLTISQELLTRADKVIE